MKLLVVAVIVFTVDALLLSAADRLRGGRGRGMRRLLGALAGALFAVLSLYPGMEALGRFWVYLLSLVGVAVIGLGISVKSLPGIGLFVLLHLSLGKLTATREDLIGMLLGAVGIGLACKLAGSREGVVTAELFYGDKQIRVRALRDTGNALTDPITGRSVLIVSAEIARQLTGLTQQQLQDPVQTIGAIPGLRLIPYQTVGNRGFLLALKLPQVRIGTWQGSTLVAFAPQSFGSNYQALTGGTQ